MLMYSTICQQHKNSDQGIAKRLTTGFSGNLTSQTDKGREVLQNLRCRTLSHFRWYKDVFLAKVVQRLDTNNEYWKAKFIDGLPTLFATKVRKRLGNELKKQNLTRKKELGEFCEEFAYNTKQPLSNQRKGKSKVSYSRIRDPYSHQSRRYSKGQSHKKTSHNSRRHPSRPPPKRNPQDKKKIVSYKCEDEFSYDSSSQSNRDHNCSCSHLKSVAQMHQINVLTSYQQILIENID
ncbi:uncharacterized protein [Aristolochia californica]|uniref:uncharacterized protein n=1 Tax=Aristolochia californica TaxID=171875 RepID=UPI0035DF9371